MNRGRIARATFAASVSLILTALWVNVALQVGRWVAWLLLAAALGLAAVVAGVMGTAGHSVTRHAKTYQRAIEAAAAHQAIEHRQAVARIVAANRKAIES